MEQTFISLLKDFGAFGSAFAIWAIATWIAWKKVFQPQQKQSRDDQKLHIETLNRIIENHSREASKHIEAEKENIKSLQELNSKISVHDEKMSLEHDSIKEKIK